MKTISNSNALNSKIIPLHTTNTSFISDRLLIKERHQIHLIPYSDIIRCEASNNYTVIHRSDRSTIVTSRCLKEISNLLPQNSFLRIHARHLVNLTYISKINTISPKSIFTTDGDEVSISRGRYKTIKNLLNL